MAVKDMAKYGLKVGAHALPVVGAFFTYATADASQSKGERIGHAVAGEAGIGPFDLDMFYDAVKAYTEQLIREDEKYGPEHQPFRHRL